MHPINASLGSAERQPLLAHDAGQAHADGHQVHLLTLAKRPYAGQSWRRGDPRSPQLPVARASQAVLRYSRRRVPHDLPFLELGEHSIEDATLGPPVHAGTDRVPVPEPLGQPSPFAPVLGQVQDGVENLAIREADVAALDR
jgi:hypothetical protein